MADPTPPSEREQDLYYGGLNLMPRLLARSSKSRWLDYSKEIGNSYYAEDHGLDERVRMLPVRTHPTLRQLWNDASSSLRQSILAAVTHTDWLFINIVRIGRNGDFPVVMLLSVPAESTSRKHAHDLVMRCAAIFREHGIEDVNCEVAEHGKLGPERASRRRQRPLPPPRDDFQLKTEIPHKYAYNIDVQLTDFLGTEIIARSDNRRSSKGLYLSLRSQDGMSRTVALCSRQAAPLESEEQTQLSQGRSDHDRYRHGVFQICQQEIAYELNDLHEYSKTNYAVDTDLMAFNNLHRRRSAVLAAFENPDSRIIGYVLHSPPFGIKIDSKGRKYLRDWALIDLEQERHEAKLNELKNRVYLEDDWWEWLTRLTYADDVSDFGVRAEFGIKRDVFSLKTTCVPMAEVCKSMPTGHSSSGDADDDSILLVAKQGAETRLTTGYPNDLVSLRNCRVGAEQQWTEALCIVRSIYKGRGNVWERPFSAEGDEGACVWDISGRPLGLISEVQSDMCPVTLVTPMESLLEDIRSEGFDVSIL